LQRLENKRVECFAQCKGIRNGLKIKGTAKGTLKKLESEGVEFPSTALGMNQNGKNTPIPRQFSQGWQVKDLRDTELGRMYGKREKWKMEK